MAVSTLEHLHRLQDGIVLAEAQIIGGAAAAEGAHQAEFTPEDRFKRLAENIKLAAMLRKMGHPSKDPAVWHSEARHLGVFNTEAALWDVNVELTVEGIDYRPSQGGYQPNELTATWQSIRRGELRKGHFTGNKSRVLLEFTVARAEVSGEASLTTLGKLGLMENPEQLLADHD